MKFEDIPNFYDSNFHLLCFGPNLQSNYDNSIDYISKINKCNQLQFRKTCIVSNNKDYAFKSSNYHVEIDFETLGVHMIHIFNSLFQHFKTSNRERRIFLCINFDRCRPELHSIFHSFMKYSRFKFIFITRQPSCIRENVLKRCMMVADKSKKNGRRYVCDKI